jgi:hypothetical protein
MRTLSFLLWTFCSMGLGVWAATVEIGGRTPVEHARRLWVATGLSLPEVPTLTAPDGPRTEGRASPPPARTRITERHTAADRDAVNKLIAQHGEKK